MLLNFRNLKKRYLISIFFDILIHFSLGKFILNGIENSFLNFDFFILTLFFLYINYFCDNYRVKSINTLRTFLIRVLKIIISSFGYLVATSIYLCYLKQIMNLYSLSKFLPYIILFFFTSSFLQLLLNNFYHKIRSKKSWIYLGEDDTFEFLISEIEYLNLGNFNISRYQVKNKRGINLDDKNIKGFIVNNTEETILKAKEINFFDKKKFILNSLDWFETYLNKLPTFLIKDPHFIDKLLKNTKKRNFQFKLKRIGDVVVSFILLIITSPLLLIAAIFIKLEDGGSIFYKQVRNGLRKKKFEIIKLRTMNQNAEEDGAKWSTFSDKRVTKIGRFLRLFRIDELPQLMQVFSGDMSLIGPRPERPEFDHIMSKEINFYDYRYQVKPGISGWAQVNYPYGSSIEDSRQKLSYDLYYLKNFTIFIDFLILFKTIRLVLNAYGSSPKKP